jgi:hypothetical protein
VCLGFLFVHAAWQKSRPLRLINWSTLPSLLGIWWALKWKSARENPSWIKRLEAQREAMKKQQDDMMAQMQQQQQQQQPGQMQMQMQQPMGGMGVGGLQQSMMQMPFA